jgi:hypothetical protein
LAVLRAVGIVSAIEDGWRHLNKIEPKELKRVHDWVKEFERFWPHQLDRIKERAERRAKGQRH